MRKLFLSFGVLLLLVQGCAHTPKHGHQSSPKWVSKKKYALVRVFYATDRNLTSSESPARMFGADYGDLSYGTCLVSIPRDHRMGELESPLIWKLEVHSDPNKNVALLQIIPQARTNFFDAINGDVNSAPGKRAFVFIHGFNISFAEAARRTAQLSYDLGFDGAPVFYSWPSQGNVFGYTRDEQSIEYSESHLEEFLNDFAVNCGATNIYVIAHSMGCHALAMAFASLAATHPAAARRFKEIILAAPDIDSVVFKTQIAPQIVSTNSPFVTIYASSNDKALAVSRSFYNGHQRLGESFPSPTVIPGTDTIDATAVDTSFFGHTYIGDERSVISDLYYLLQTGESLEQFRRAGMERVGTAPDEYWKFRP
ncbi:MAG TPA: alpha/beta fold hydrolase [Verrucomicrobiae bacterium]|jgi:esterase/lipase superfamily enzyme|nr:alpha/beta fold hydrolase [Verrucomicrobiae bacterium]